MFPVLVGNLGKSYHVTLDETDVTLCYVNRQSMKEVLRREGSKYLVAE